MNGLFVLLGIESWKPILSALLLPPVPLLLLTLLGTRMVAWRRGVGWLVVMLSTVMLWLSCCSGFSDWLVRVALKPPGALGEDRIAALKREAAAGHTAIVVLGGGSEVLAPEYGVSNLAPVSLERLRYGVWLSRETGLPIAFSGGAGFAQPGAPSEAEIASRIAAREFNRPLRWAETESRDTRENAAHTLALLQPAGITRIVLVTNGYHMRRAERNFNQAVAARPDAQIEVLPAPMGLSSVEGRLALRWMPSNDGYSRTRNALHELAGLLFGA